MLDMRKAGKIYGKNVVAVDNVTLSLETGVVGLIGQSVRDFKADTECMGSAVAGGANQRYWRQSAAAIVLGLLLTASVMWRWVVDEPLRALGLGSAIVALAGLAQLLGRATRTGRTFTVLFLCGLYIATQAAAVPALDVVGMHGTATPASIWQQLLADMLY